MTAYKNSSISELRVQLKVTQVLLTETKEEIDLSPELPKHYDSSPPSKVGITIDIEDPTLFGMFAPGDIYTISFEKVAKTGSWGTAGDRSSVIR